MLGKLWTFLKSFLPNYGPFLSRGYRAKTFNSDLIFVKNVGRYRIHLHQSVEPFNPRWGDLGDLAPETACLVITGDDLGGPKESLQKIFEFVFVKGDYLFCHNKHMELDDTSMPSLLDRVEKLLS